MKKKRNLPLLIVCLLLLAALIGSLFLLRSAKEDVKQLEAQILELGEKNQQLSALNQALQTQLDSSLSQSGPAAVYIEEDYCTLVVDSWSVSGNVLTADTFAQAIFIGDPEFTAKIELWRGDAVVSSHPVTLSPSEASNVYEGKVSVSFEMPEIPEGEELQLWLMVEPEGRTAVFTYAAGWYLENGQWMLISG